MNAVIFIFLVVAASLIFFLPRRQVLLPILIGTLYFGCYLQIEIGPTHFTITRILIVLGLLRVMAKREHLAGGWNGLDRAMLFWAVWAVFSGFFHVPGTLVFRLGMELDTFGAYLLFRILIQDSEDMVNLCQVVCIIFLPLGMAMVYEKLTGKNSFAMLGGAPGGAELRDGHFRARGPFIHQILAGTVGAVCLPLAFFMWRQKRALALTGMIATCAIVYASGSSGPILTVLAVCFAMALWMIQDHLRLIRWLAVLMVFIMAMIMNDPVYYILARINITGGSTGWHRAALIDGAIKHFGDWWIIGTDYTRDWMPTGIEANADNTDITNHFLLMGVWGGMPLMLLFIWVLTVAFRRVGRELKMQARMPVEKRFLIWILGSILFADVVTFMSISYFDQQTSIFLYLLLAAISSICVTTAVKSPIEGAESRQSDNVHAAEMA